MNVETVMVETVMVETVMSDPVVSITPTDTIVTAADLMRRHAVGFLPVLEGSRLVGIVTDRDIVIRAISDRHDIGNRPVGDIMSAGPVTCRADQSVADAAALMGEEQVRRLLVLDESQHIVGVLSLDDIARDVSEELAGQVLGEIVEER